MKAITIKEAGGELNYEEISNPVLQESEVLIEVKTIGINPIDVKTRNGNPLFDKIIQNGPCILGWDVSGVITECGKNAAKFKVGDEVFGMINFPGHGKAYAEYVAASENHLALKPDNTSHEKAAASSLAALTAFQALKNRIKKDDKVLIHSASGGVGHFAVQLAKEMGAYVIATSSAKNRNFVLSLGANEHIDYQTQNFEEILSDLDLVFDGIGGDYIQRSLKTLKKGGIIVSLPSGLNDGIEEKAAAQDKIGYKMMVQSNGDDMATLAKMLENGSLKPYVSLTFGFDDMDLAHKKIASGRTIGKLVVKL